MEKVTLATTKIADKQHIDRVKENSGNGNLGLSMFFF
jgi:hypothetical protein